MLSIIIPVYNEAESLELLFAEIDEVAKAHNYQLDLVFVTMALRRSSVAEDRGHFQPRHAHARF